MCLSTGKREWEMTILVQAWRFKHFLFLDGAVADDREKKKTPKKTAVVWIEAGGGGGVPYLPT